MDSLGETLWIFPLRICTDWCLFVRCAKGCEVQKFKSCINVWQLQRGGGEARCSSITGAFGTGEWWGVWLKIPITWRILDRIMFRFFDGPSMAPSVCVDINFGEIDHGKGCFWQMTKGGKQVHRSVQPHPYAINPPPGTEGWRAHRMCQKRSTTNHL